MSATFDNSIHQRRVGNFSTCTGLTSRQIECVALAGRGKTDWEIGKILGISEETVKRHITDARNHYDVPKRIQVVLHAIAEGIISLTDLIGRQERRNTE